MNKKTMRCFLEGEGGGVNARGINVVSVDSHSVSSYQPDIINYEAKEIM